MWYTNSMKTKYIDGKSMGWYYSKVVRIILRKYNELLSPYDISAQQSGVLYLLYEAEKEGDIMTQSDITMYLFLNKVSTHSLIKNLLKRKMISKISSKTDKRFNYISLTNKGRSIISNIEQIDAQIEQELYEHCVPHIMSDKAYRKVKEMLRYVLNLSISSEE